MEKTITWAPELLLVGISCRTKNSDEMDEKQAKIGPLVARYQSEGLASKIRHRSDPGKTYSVYLEYESDFTGEYTYFIGEVVTSFMGVDRSLFKTITIPRQKYALLKNGPGPMPAVLIQAWKNIWNMNSHDLGGTRTYRADLQLIYPAGPNTKTMFMADIYLGIK